MTQNLFGQIQIAFGATGVGVVEDYGLSETGAFAQADIPGNDRIEYHGPKMFSHLIRHLMGDIIPFIKHGQKDPFDPQEGVQIIFN